MRIVKLVKHLSLTVYDFQKLNLICARDSISSSSSSSSSSGGTGAGASGGGGIGVDYYSANYVDLNKLSPSYMYPVVDTPTFLNLTNEPYAVIEAKFENISKIHQQQYF